MQSLFKCRSSTLSNVGLANLFIVYIVWSSTYLAIRVALEEGSGLSPLMMGFIRMFLAGAILIGFAVFQRHRIRLTVREWLILIPSSILLWVLSNGLLMWSEQYANSGFAALVVATTPIIVAFLDSLLLRRTPSRLLIGSLFLSFCGLAVLMAPSLMEGNTTEFTAGLALLLCAFSWSCGSVFQNRNPLSLPFTVIAGYQHLIAGCAYGLLVLVFHEPLPHPSTHAWLALVYLILFGSVLAYTAFVTALSLLPINIAMTYAYVNPVLALLLGWWLLSEPITWWTLLGAAMVILGVIGVFRDRSRLPQLEKR
ncbi:MAG: EamA family transporter [Syntrophomonas sp.]|nr:EamA family transporter [Syntrophomonas sp.]